MGPVALSEPSYKVPYPRPQLEYHDGMYQPKDSVQQGGNLAIYTSAKDAYSASSPGEQVKRAYDFCTYFSPERVNGEEGSSPLETNMQMAGVKISTDWAFDHAPYANVDGRFQYVDVAGMTKIPDADFLAGLKQGPIKGFNVSEKSVMSDNGAGDDVMTATRSMFCKSCFGGDDVQTTARFCKSCFGGDDAEVNARFCKSCFGGDDAEVKAAFCKSCFGGDDVLTTVAFCKSCFGGDDAEVEARFCKSCFGGDVLAQVKCDCNNSDKTSANHYGLGASKYYNEFGYKTNDSLWDKLKYFLKQNYSVLSVSHMLGVDVDACECAVANDQSGEIAAAGIQVSKYLPTRSAPSLSYKVTSVAKVDSYSSRFSY